jgi:hypothetical protein
MKKLSLILALSLASVASFAQMYTVYGNVQDANNNAVVGQVVTAQVWNQWLDSAITDANGDYSIDIPNNTTVGSFIDIKTYASSCNTWYTDSTVFYNQQGYQADFTLCANTQVNYYVTGQVMTGNNGADAAIVYLISQEYDSNSQSYTLTAIDSVVADTQSGYYSMPVLNTYPGVLKVKAALLPISADYASYLPTYFTSSLTWNGNGVTSVNQGMNTTANISLIAGTNPGGPAFIGGDVTQGANKGTAFGDPLPNRILILTDVNNAPVAYVYSDVNGEFSITNLAYGTYHLFGDAWGKTNTVLTFTLDANNPSFTNIAFHEDTEEFWGALWPLSVGTAPELSNVAVYPNPATDVLNIKGLNAVDGAKTITLSSVTGAVVFSATYGQNDNVSIPVSSLNSGLYMLNISTAKGNVIYKIVK